MAFDMSKRSSYFLISPMALIFAIFLVVPLLTIIVVSFWDYDEYRILPDFIFPTFGIIWKDGYIISYRI